MSDIQGVFISDVGPPPYRTYAVRDDAPERSIILPPGCQFRVYTDDDGYVVGVVVIHETTAPDGTRHIHENDYSLRPAGQHVDIVQRGGGVAP